MTKQEELQWLARHLDDHTGGNHIIWIDWGNHYVDCGSCELKNFLVDLAKDYIRLSNLEKEYNELTEVESTLATNLVDTSFIGKIQLFGAVVKSPTGSDRIDEIVITMSDSVQTQFRITTNGEQLVLELSHMQQPPPQAKVRVNYLDTNVLF